MLEQESEFVVQMRVRRGIMGGIRDVGVEESDGSFLRLKGVKEVLDQLAELEMAMGVVEVSFEGGEAVGGFRSDMDGGVAAIVGAAEEVSREPAGREEVGVRRATPEQRGCIHRESSSNRHSRLVPLLQLLARLKRPRRLSSQTRHQDLQRVIPLRHVC